MAERQTAQTTDKGHGRIERRSLTSTGALRDYLDWPHCSQAFKLTRERTMRGVTTAETVYGITSLPPDKADADRLLMTTRRHWEIESLHYIRDVTMGEDQCRVRTGSAPIVLATLRNAAFHMLKRAGIRNMAAALRRHAAVPAEALALVQGFSSG